MDPKIVLQAGVIPFRRIEEGLEICLITSIGAGHWGFPKGNIEPGETAREAALKEAFEEAGLQENIRGEEVGSYRYEKWGAELEVTMFVMEVTESAQQWQECEMRQRAWLSAKDALSRLGREPLRELLHSALRQLTFSSSLSGDGDHRPSASESPSERPQI